MLIRLKEDDLEQIASWCMRVDEDKEEIIRILTLIWNESERRAWLMQEDQRH